MRSQTFLSTRLLQCACILIALLSVQPLAHAQMIFPRPPVSVTQAPLLLPPTTTSDPVAIQALQRVIDASGGMEAWKRIRSAKVRLGISSPTATQSHEFVMLDDWSSEATRYRRGAVGGKRTPHEHNGQSTFNASDKGKDKVVPEFDQARVLAGSLPAAAAEIILRRSSYVAKQAAGTRCTADMLCIDIYRQPAPNTAFIREEEWLISQSTGLPTVIDIALPNLTGVRPIYEEFQFEEMLAVDGVTIPGKIEMQHPSGATQIRKVVSFVPNARFDTSAFDQEVSR